MELLPHTYTDREHQFIKHKLLQIYLERLLLIIGQHNSLIYYVDTFAGPWSEKTPDFSDTSIGISLEIMERCRKALRGMNKAVEFKALYIESDPTRFEKLSEFLSNRRGIVDAEAMRGNFIDLRGEILEWTGRSVFTFFFIDPCGWKGLIGKPALAPLLARHNCELLINFMYDFINRFGPQGSRFDKDMEDLFGEVPDVAGMEPKEREIFLVRLYKNRLKEASKRQGIKRWSMYFPILEKDKDRTKYHLVYLTEHPYGMEVFGEASEEADESQNDIHATAVARRKIRQRTDRTGTNDLFAEEVLRPDDLHIDIGRRLDRDAQLKQAKEYWLARIPVGYKEFWRRDFADALDETDLFPGIHQEALGQLIVDGYIENPDWSKRRKKYHVQFKKGERLRRVR